jgi:hypothetical protein
MSYNYDAADGLEELTKTLVASIDRIHPSAYNLLWFWHTKQTHDQKFSVKPFEERDSYERVDNYNLIGMSAYFMMKLNQRFQGLSCNWQMPQSHLFTYEVMQSFLLHCLK